MNGTQKKYNMTGYINYQEGIFLGKEELRRHQLMMREFMISLLKKGTSGLGLFYELEKLCRIYIAGNNLVLSTTSQSLMAGIDFQSEIIKIPGINDTVYCKASIERAGTFEVYIGAYPHSFEQGTVTIDQSGYVVGSGTSFSEIFRNSAKGRYSRFRTSDGEMRIVQNIVSDTELQLYGEANNFIVGRDLQFEIFPTLSPFYVEDDLEPLYSYDLSRLYMYESGETPQEAGLTQFKIGTALITGSVDNWSLQWGWDENTPSPTPGPGGGITAQPLSIGIPSDGTSQEVNVITDDNWTAIEL